MHFIYSCAMFVYLYISSSLFFHGAHFLFHQWSASQWRALRWLSRCHQFHHLYYNRSLKLNEQYRLQNSLIALPLEMSCLIAGSILGRVFFPQLLKANVAEVQSTTLTVVIIVHFIRTFVVIAMNGRDSNHVTYHVVPKDPHWLFVGPQYHALHHVHPDRFMASVVKIFDWVAGTAYSLRNKNVAITGSSGAFGSSILSQLQTEGVRNIYTLEFGTHWTYRDLSKVGPIFDKADILILADGTKNQDAMEANCNSTIRLIRLYMERRLSGASGGKILPEIWYVGSEVEMHPTFGVTDMQRYAHSKRAFVPYARALYDCPHVVYRHIVPAAFQSRMGNAFVSSEWAASSTMWWIRRGARYIPVTYTGIADLNFLKFAFWVRPDKDMVAGSGVGNRFMDTPGEKGRLP